MAEEISFSRGPARRPAPKISDPILQWATGLQTKQRTIYAGWLCEANKNPALDTAMEQAGFQRVIIKHGSGSLVTHWALEKPSLFIIADGVQSINEMKGTEERLGIAFGWKTLPGGRLISQLRCRAFIHELLVIGYQEPVVVTLKGTVTGDFLAALNKQFDALEAIDKFRADDKKPPLKPPFYALSVPIGPGKEVARGTTQTKEIAPPVADIPLPVTRQYILDHWAKRDWVALIEGLADQTITWSVAFSKQIAAGTEGGPPQREQEDEEYNDFE